MQQVRWSLSTAKRTLLLQKCSFARACTRHYPWHAVIQHRQCTTVMEDSIASICAAPNRGTMPVLDHHPAVVLQVGASERGCSSKQRSRLERFAYQGEQIRLNLEGAYSKRTRPTPIDGKFQRPWPVGDLFQHSLEALEPNQPHLVRGNALLLQVGQNCDVASTCLSKVDGQRKPHTCTTYPPATL